LNATVAVVDQAIVGTWPAGMDRLFQGIQDEAGGGRSADFPANDPPCVGIDHTGNVHKAGPCVHIEPALAKAGVKSNTHSALGQLTLKSRLTLSNGHAALGLLTVVIVVFPRLIPEVGERDS